MAFFTTENQTSQYYKDPTPYRGNKFVLGLMGYKADGTKSTFGKITDTALPILGGVGGALIGGPAGAALGAKIGSFAGQGLDFLGNKSAEDMTAGTDAQANVQADLAGTLARSQLGAGLGELATGTMAGLSGDNKGDLMGALTKSFTGAAPAIGTGLAGTLAANPSAAMSTNKNSQRIRYFAGGGDTPLPAKQIFRSGRPGRDYTLGSQLRRRTTDDMVDQMYGTGPAPVRDLPSPEALPARGIFNSGRAVRNYSMNNRVENRINDGLFDQIYGTGPDPVRSGSTTAPPMMLPEVNVTAKRDDRFVGDNMEPLASRGYRPMGQAYKNYQMVHPVLNRVDNEMHDAEMDAKYAPAPKRTTAVGRFLRRAFKEGGESGGISYAMAGAKGYKVYDDDDDTEDLHITRPDGTPYGKMRFGERIFDQKSNLTMKAVMGSDAPVEEKKKALGNHIFDELLTHKNVDGEREFAAGGESAPGPGTLNDAFNAAVKAKQPTFMHNGKVHRVIDLDPMAGAWAAPKPAAAPANQTELQRYQASAYYQGNNPSAAPTVPAPTPTPVPKSTTTASSGRVNVRATQTTRTAVRPAARTAAAAPAMPAAMATVPMVHTVAAGDTIDKLATKYNTNRADLMIHNNLQDPNRIQVGQVLNLKDPRTMVKTPEMSTGTATDARAQAIMSPVDPNAARVANLNANLAVKPETAQGPATASDTSGNIGNSLLNFGRIAAGASLASKEVPTYSLPDSYVKWRGEVESRKNQGLSPAEWAAANGSITSNYTAGVNAQTGMLGGGASPGAALAGLTRLNQISGQSRLAVDQADVARKAQNFGMYTNAVNGGLGIDRQLYEDTANRAAATQQAGVGLVQAGLQDMQQSKLFDQNYGPNSLYAKLMGISANKEQASLDYIQQMKKKQILQASN